MTPAEISKLTLEICTKAPVIPVLVLNDISKAIPLAEALIRGGLPVLEVTLRTPNALAIIKEMSSVTGGYVGAGTVLSSKDAEAVKKAGGIFAVSPGSTDLLLEACEAIDMPILPGAVTSTEAMKLLELGYTTQKFFPAKASGGAPAIKAIGSPLPQITFCPTGGVTYENANDYLSLSNVRCVGGSWVAPRDAIEANDWDRITELARAASKLG